MSGRPIHDHQIDLARLGRLHTLAAVLHNQGLEFLVQRQLLGQRIAHLGIVVDDENPLPVRHCRGSLDSARAGVLHRAPFDHKL